MSKDKSYDELMVQIAELQGQAALVLQAEREDALSQVRKTVKKYGFTAKELGIATTDNQVKKAQQKKSDAKYVHPDNPDLKWTGHGKRPKWFQELLNSGKSLDELRVLPAANG